MILPPSTIPTPRDAKVAWKAHFDIPALNNGAFFGFDTMLNRMLTEGLPPAPGHLLQLSLSYRLRCSAPCGAADEIVEVTSNRLTFDGDAFGAAANVALADGVPKLALTVQRVVDQFIPLLRSDSRCSTCQGPCQDTHEATCAPLILPVDVQAPGALTFKHGYRMTYIDLEINFGNERYELAGVVYFVDTNHYMTRFLDRNGSHSVLWQSDGMRREGNSGSSENRRGRCDRIDNGVAPPANWFPTSLSPSSGYSPCVVNLAVYVKKKAPTGLLNRVANAIFGGKN